MSTIDKFMVRSKSTALKEAVQRPEDKDVAESAKSLKRKNVGDGADTTKKFRAEETNLKGEAGSEFIKTAADSSLSKSDPKILKSTESTVEISYEDYLMESHVESPQVDVKDETSGRDIRNYFSKGFTNTPKNQTSFTTLKIKAEIHGPSSTPRGDVLENGVTAVEVELSARRKERRKRNVKRHVDVTDEDLVIECLDDGEPVNQIMASGQVEAENGLSIDKCSNKEREVEDLKPVILPPVVISVDEVCGQDFKLCEKATECLQNRATKGPSVYDVLMGSKKKIHEQNSVKQTLVTGVENETETRKKSRGGKSTSDKECLKVDQKSRNQVIKQPQTSLNRDDEETRVYLPTDSPCSEPLPQLGQTRIITDEDSNDNDGQAPENCGTNITAGLVTSSRTNGNMPHDQGDGTEPRRSLRLRSAVRTFQATNSIQAKAENAPKQEIIVPPDPPAETEIVIVDDCVNDSVVESEIRFSRQTKEGSKKNQRSATNLAPIFTKQAASKKPAAKLSAYEAEIIEKRRNFLMSGVPEELKKLQDSLQSAIIPFADAPFPVLSHIVQSDSLSDGRMDVFDPWKLPEVLLKLREMTGFVMPTTSSFGRLTLINDDEKFDDVAEKSAEIAEIPADVLPALLLEMKSYNPPFPADRIYQQLLTRKNFVADTNAKLTAKEDTVAEPKNAKKMKRRTSLKLSKTATDNLEVKKECAGDDSENSKTLWTEKYAPTRANEIVGNWDTCKKLRDWLIEWKQAISRNSSAKNFQDDDDKSFANVSGDFESSSNDSDSDDEYSSLCNTMLLLGAHGIGKTSMVYALAQELDFKVFEVNSSGSRDGRYVLTQLQEATQSHQISRRSQEDVLQNENKDLPIGQKKEKKLAKDKATKKTGAFGGLMAHWTVAQGKKESAASKRGRKPKDKESSNKAQPSQNPDVRRPSLILFDEVDIVLSEDRGFWSAVQTFMKITKRPIILTATDKNFVRKFGGECECLKLRVPRLANTASYVQLVCLAENIRTNYDDVLSLVDYFAGDVRKTLLLIQFWAQSGAARQRVFDAPIQCTSNKQVEDSPTAVDQKEITPEPTNGLTTADEPKEQDSEDEFSAIVPRKRRRIQICSDDESNHSVQTNSNSAPVTRVGCSTLVLDDFFQDSCSQASFDCEFKGGVGNGVVVAQNLMDLEGISFPLHRINANVVGNGDSHILNQFSKVLERNDAEFLGNHRPQQKSVFNQFVPRLHARMSALQSCNQKSSENNNANSKKRLGIYQSSMRSLYDVYNTMSFTDVYDTAIRRHESYERLGGVNEWHFVDQAFTTVETMESILVSAFVGRGQDCSSKANGYQKQEGTDALAEDDEVQRNHYSRLFKKNADNCDGVAEKILQPSVILSRDYLPALRTICKSEELRRTTVKRRRGFNHYLNNVFPTMKTSLFNDLMHQFQ